MLTPHITEGGSVCLDLLCHPTHICLYCEVWGKQIGMIPKSGTLSAAHQHPSSNIPRLYLRCRVTNRSKVYHTRTVNNGLRARQVALAPEHHPPTTKLTNSHGLIGVGLLARDKGHNP
jgi:hypothetical protein